MHRDNLVTTGVNAVAFAAACASCVFVSFSEHRIWGGSYLQESHESVFAKLSQNLSEFASLIVAMKANLFEMPEGGTTPDHQLVRANQSHHLVIINQLLYDTAWRKNITELRKWHSNASSSIMDLSVVKQHFFWVIVRVRVRCEMYPDESKSPASFMMLQSPVSFSTSWLFVTSYLC